MNSSAISDNDRSSAQLLGRLPELDAQEAGRSRNELLAGVSHEIRSPLHVIIGMSELLLETDLDARQTEYQKQVLGAAEELLAVLQGRPGSSGERAAGATATPEAQPPEAIGATGGRRPGEMARRPARTPVLEVLVAEDGRANQMVAKGFLERCGHRVTVAESGPEALSALARERFDAVLMDIQMPGMDGLAATRAIRHAEEATGAHTPIIAMTANAMPGDREACLAAGMDGYLAKPVHAAELYEALDRLTAPRV